MSDESLAWSVPERTIIDTIGDLLDDEQDGVLATIVSVEGNAYRRPGAKMVFTPDGAGVGSITAGCLEDEVLALASEVIEEGRPRVETYNLIEDDDVWGLGVGCNGIINVLLEPIHESLRPLVEATRAGENVAVLTVLPDEAEKQKPIAKENAVDGQQDSDDTENLSAGHHGYIHPDGTFDIETGSVLDGAADSLADPASDLLERGKSSVVEVETTDGPIKVFVDGIQSSPSLVVFGTGHDVAPVVELARKNDFRVTVVGFRGANATNDRFPHADDVQSASPSDLQNVCEFDDDTYAVVMTHNFVDDRIAVAELLEMPVPYIGLMGPQDRFEEILEAFADEGRTFDDGELDRLYTPIGLDLGGGSPYQIAHSIIAEVLAVANDRTPQHLSERKGPIHDRISVVSEND
jgi:xanthine dehydrogenase accessory factor